MPTSVGILTASFSSPLPYPGHLFLRPHHPLKPSTLFTEISWNPLPSLNCSLSHHTFTEMPRFAGGCFHTWLLPPPWRKEGTFLPPGCQRTGSALVHHRLPLLSWESHITWWSLCILQRCHGLLLNSLLLSCLGMPPGFSVLASTSSLASTRVTRASTFMPH